MNIRRGDIYAPEYRRVVNVDRAIENGDGLAILEGIKQPFLRIADKGVAQHDRTDGVRRPAKPRNGLVGRRGALIEIDILNAVIPRIGASPIQKINWPARMVGLPSGQRGEILAPIEVGLAEQPQSATAAAASNVEERNEIRIGKRGFRRQADDQQPAAMPTTRLPFPATRQTR